MNSRGKFCVYALVFSTVSIMFSAATLLVALSMWSDVDGKLDGIRMDLTLSSCVKLTERR